MKSKYVGRARNAPALGRFALAAFLLLEPACSSGSGAVVEKEMQKEAKREVAGLVITKVSPVENCLSAIKQGNEENASKLVFPFLAGKNPQEERKAVFDAFAAKFGADATAKATFDFLREGPPKEYKYQVVDLFVEKYQGSALRVLYMKAVTDFGVDFTTPSKSLEKENPTLLSYMQAIGYGISKFGAAGFIAAETLVANMDAAQIFRVPLFSKRDNPLSAPLVLMVCKRLAKDGTINVSGAIDYLANKYLLEKKGNFTIPEEVKAQFGGYLKDGGPSTATKSLVVAMIDAMELSSGNFGHSALKKILENPNLDPEARMVIEIDLGKPVSAEKR